MTTDQQKAAERRTAERFLASLDPGRVWEVESAERPDFIVRFGNESVGLEVSNLYRKPAAGTPRQTLENHSLSRLPAGDAPMG
jgi:hypothetical protein